MTQILLGAGHTHHRRCHYAHARADGGAYGASNESASKPASDKVDCGDRRNRATQEREGQSYHRNNFHQASSSFGGSIFTEACHDEGFGERFHYPP
jgi:hypothetical protein